MSRIVRRFAILIVCAAGLLPVTAAEAQWYGDGASRQPPFYPYEPQRGQPYAVEVAPGTYVIHHPGGRHADRVIKTRRVLHEEPLVIERRRVVHDPPKVMTRRRYAHRARAPRRHRHLAKTVRKLASHSKSARDPRRCRNHYSRPGPHEHPPHS